MSLNSQKIMNTHFTYIFFYDILYDYFQNNLFNECRKHQLYVDLNDEMKIDHITFNWSLYAFIYWRETRYFAPSVLGDLEAKIAENLERKKHESCEVTICIRRWIVFMLYDIRTRSFSPCKDYPNSNRNYTQILSQ